MTSEALLTELKRIHELMEEMEKRLSALEERRDDVAMMEPAKTPKRTVILQKSYDGQSGEVVSTAVTAETPAKKTPLAARRSVAKAPLGRKTSGGLGRLRRPNAPNAPKKPFVNRFLLVGTESSAKWSLVRQMLSLSERFPAKFQRCDSHWAQDSPPPSSEDLTTLRLGVISAAVAIVSHISNHQIPYSSLEVSRIALQLLDDFQREIDLSDLSAIGERLILLAADSTFQKVLHQNVTKRAFDGCADFLRREKITKIFDDDVKWNDVVESNLKCDESVFYFKIRDKRFEITVLDDVEAQNELPLSIDSWIKAHSLHRNSRIHILYAASLDDIAIPLPQRPNSPPTTQFDFTLAHFSRCLRSAGVARCALLIYFTNKHKFEAQLNQSAFRQIVAAVFEKELGTTKTRGKHLTESFLAPFAVRFSERISAVSRGSAPFEKNVYHRFTSPYDDQILDGLLAAVKDQIISDSLSESALF